MAAGKAIDTQNQEYRVTIKRGDANTGVSSVEYTVSVTNPHARVLDLMLRIRQEQDPSLAFRYSCRVGMCGSCAVVINGREGLACQTPLSGLGTRDIEVAPLRSLPVKRDLVPDMEPFFNAMKRGHTALVPKEPERRDIRTMPPGDPKRAVIEQHNGCITCGACFSACEWTRTHDGYLGPSALARMFMLAQDERDARGEERLERVGEADGVMRCHSMGNCAVVCPVGIPLKTGMMRLKALLARRG